MTIKELAEKSELKVQIIRIPFRTDFIGDENWNETARHFAFRFYFFGGERSGKQMKGNYSQGSAIKTMPHLEDILDSVLLDTDGIEGTSFDMWAGDLGYSSDSISAMNIYQQCLKEYEQLRNLLGEKLLSQFRQCDRL